MKRKKTKKVLYTGRPSKSTLKKVAGEINLPSPGAISCECVCDCTPACECVCDPLRDASDWIESVEERFERLESVMQARFGDIETILKRISRQINAKETPRRRT